MSFSSWNRLISKDTHTHTNDYKSRWWKRLARRRRWVQKVASGACNWQTAFSRRSEYRRYSAAARSGLRQTRRQHAYGVCSATGWVGLRLRLSGLSATSGVDRDHPGRPPARTPGTASLVGGAVTTAGKSSVAQGVAPPSYLPAAAAQLSLGRASINQRHAKTTDRPADRPTMRGAP